MLKAVIDADGFEAKFRSDIDPWNYEASAFEAHKRGVLLRACGARAYGRGLEIACAIGVTTRHLAPRCRRLLATDASPTALGEAARRNADLRNVTFAEARLPEDAPRGTFDLIVASEILYYLPRRGARAVVDAMAAAVAPGGRIVVLHHVRDFEDAAQRPRAAQDDACARLGRSMRRVFDYREPLFHAAAFEKPSPRTSNA